MSAQPLPRITPEQYLEMERAAEFKSEYFEGQVYAMAGGTYPHATIITNVSGELRQALKQKPCTVTSSETRLRVSSGGLYTYPDVMVVRGEARFADDQKDTLLNPTLIVEVLSKSTEANDRGFKFAQYRKLDSLGAYVLVSQSEPRVETFHRQADERWVLSEFVGVDAVCRFESLNCQVLLSDIYHRVTLGEEPPNAPGMTVNPSEKFST
jgi:Uma2 family endonuclease